MPAQLFHKDTVLGNGTGISIAQPILQYSISEPCASLAVRGNINGDGWNDLVICEGFDDGRLNDKPNTGAVLIISGKDGSLIRELHSPAPAAQDAFGYSTCFLGNVTWVDGSGNVQVALDHADADGKFRDELAVGAPLADRQVGTGSSTVFNVGVVFIYDSYQLTFTNDTVASGPPVPPAATVEVPELPTSIVAGWKFGFSLAYAGLARGTSFPQFVVGAPGAFADRRGKAYLMNTQIVANTVASLKSWDGTAPIAGDPGENFGFSVAGNGTVDGDMLPDILVGAPLAQTGAGASGRTGAVRAYTGTGLSNDMPIRVFPTGAEVIVAGGARFGQAIAFPLIQCTNGAAQIGLAIGQPQTRTFPPAAPAPAGRVSIFRKSSPSVDFAYVYDIGVAGPPAAPNNDQWGFALSPTLSLNGTGSMNLIVGAPSHTAMLPGGVTRPETGYVGVVDWTQPAPAPPPFLFWTQASVGSPVSAQFDELGYAVCGLGKWGQVDDLPDIAAGAPFADPRGIREAGEVRVFDPNVGTNSAPIARVQGTFSGRYFAEVVVTGFDSDGDGVNDFAVGMPSADIVPSEDVDVAGSGPDDDETSVPDTGRVFIIRGVSPYAVLRVMDSPEPGARFGTSIAIADLDGDGTLDFLIGAPLANSGHGSVFSYSGASGAAVDTRPTRRINSPLPTFFVNERFGQAIAIVGDWGLPCPGGNGLPDVAVSSPGASYIHVYDGFNTLLGLLPVEMYRFTPTTSQLTDYIGWSLAAGDVDPSTTRLELIAGCPQNPRVVGQACSMCGPGYVLVLTQPMTCDSVNPPTAIPTLATLPLSPTLVPPGSALGFSVAVPGNVNAPSTPADIVAGAPYDMTVGVDEGSIVVLNDVFTGTPTTDRVTSPAPIGTTLGAMFGFAVSGAGYVYGTTCTGPVHFLVGAPGADPGGVIDGGSVYVYRYNPLLPPPQIESTIRIDAPTDTIAPDATKGYFGTTLSGPGMFAFQNCHSESLLGSPGTILFDANGFRASGMAVFGINRKFPRAGRAWVFTYNNNP
ncbi:MAG: FG-GAP repeat protein [Planctomycetes bacterium]|nr:FG-GAP repeat protein [Planctomycetota bacterium]MBI3847270.1 FG-GAP repeat protein [Planctomycetota bacterium]